jgi:magnesium chelatase subunit I
VEVIRRRDAYENGYGGFMETWRPQDAALRARILAARAALPAVTTPNTVLHDCASLCIAIGSDGLRGELTLLRAARALAALEGDEAVGRLHLKAVAPMCLSHRLRRDPLDEAGSTTRVIRALGEVLP